MTRQRACIYCRIGFRAATLTAEPVLPAGLGGRLALKRAACPECSARILGLTDDFLSTRFALTARAAAATARRRPARARGRTPSDSPAVDASPDDWRRACRAAAKILYCYLLLELGPPALTSPASEMLRRFLMDDRERALAATLGGHSTGALTVAELARVDVRFGGLGRGGRAVRDHLVQVPPRPRRPGPARTARRLRRLQGSPRPGGTEIPWGVALPRDRPLGMEGLSAGRGVTARGARVARRA